MHIAMSTCVCVRACVHACVRERRIWNVAFNLNISVCLESVYSVQGCGGLICGKVWVVFTSSGAFGVRLVFSVYL